MVIAVSWQSRRRSSFRAVEAEDFARARLGVAGVGKAGDQARGFVEERQRRLVVDPLELGGGVAFGLRFVHRQVLAFFFALGFDDADRLLVDEEHVVSRAGIGLPFAHGNTCCGAKIDLVFGLHHPAGGTQLRVNAVAGLLLGVLVFAHGRRDAVGRSGDDSGRRGVPSCQRNRPETQMLRSTGENGQNPNFETASAHFPPQPGARLIDGNR